MTAVTPAPPDTAVDRRLPAPYLRAGPVAARLRAAGFAFGAALLFAVAPAGAVADFRLALLAKYLCSRWSPSASGSPGAAAACSPSARASSSASAATLMAMHLKLADAGPGGMPDFMALYGARTSCRAGGSRSASPGSALLATVLLPDAGRRSCSARWSSAAGSAAPTSPSSVQALAAALAILLIGQQGTTGGTNGLTDFTRLLRLRPRRPGQPADGVLHHRRRRCWRCSRWPASSSAAATASCWWRSATPRSGSASSATTRPTSSWSRTWSRRAWPGWPGRCSCRPWASSRRALIGIVPSIEFVIGVAVGGRATLLGPVLGAVAVAWARTALSERFPAPGRTCRAASSCWSWRSCPAAWRRCGRAEPRLAAHVAAASPLPTPRWTSTGPTSAAERRRR